MAQARGLFKRALALDPKNIDAMVGLADVDTLAGLGYFTEDRAAHLAAAEATLVKALCLAPNHDFAHLVLGSVLIHTNRAAQGIAECERALALARNLAWAHWQIGVAKFCMGRGSETEAHINEAFRLSPRDMVAFNWLQVVGLAKLQLTADGEAVSWFRRSIEANRNFPLTHFHLAAALGLLSALAARARLALDPSFTIRRFRDGAPSDNPTFLATRERIYQGMRMAGGARRVMSLRAERRWQRSRAHARHRWKARSTTAAMKPRDSMSGAPAIFSATASALELAVRFQHRL